MQRIAEVKALRDHRVWLRFENGVVGEVDLSDLAGEGVFAAWNEPGFFAKVTIDPVTHTLSWPRGIDLCPDALFEDVQRTSQDDPRSHH